MAQMFLDLFSYQNTLASLFGAFQPELALCTVSYDHTYFGNSLLIPL